MSRGMKEWDRENTVSGGHEGVWDRERILCI